MASLSMRGSISHKPIQQSEAGHGLRALKYTRPYLSLSAEVSDGKLSCVRACNGVNTALGGIHATSSPGHLVGGIS